MWFLVFMVVLDVDGLILKTDLCCCWGERYTNYIVSKNRSWSVGHFTVFLFHFPTRIIFLKGLTLHVIKWQFILGYILFLNCFTYSIFMNIQDHHWLEFVSVLFWICQYLTQLVPIMILFIWNSDHFTTSHFFSLMVSQHPGLKHNRLQSTLPVKFLQAQSCQ